MSKRLLVIVGPTGSGKTDLSIRLARHYGAPILSTDSRQCYRGMPIEYIDNPIYDRTSPRPSSCARPSTTSSPRTTSTPS